MQWKSRKTLIVLGIVLATAIAMLPTTDRLGDHYVDTAFKRALVTYALARGLNGVISVAQGTEVAVQPAGIGVNFTPGEILDPINDLVERFSWIMMLASSSLGVQKVLLAMSSWHGLLLVLVLVAGATLGVYLLWDNPKLKRWLTRLFFFLLLLRFMMPAIAIANDWVYRTFLETDYNSATVSLETARDSIEGLNQTAMVDRESEPEGLISRAKDMYGQVLESVDIEKRLEDYKQAASTVSENTIRLVVVFLMQTLVFPLLFLMISIRFARRLIRW
ncbi:MAG: hypothetical protein KTR35_06310 [Gammaproteobacteria bacterium]|nr:hypothetical protein [Gammaproteobacteria bacterium]